MKKLLLLLVFGFAISMQAQSEIESQIKACFNEHTNYEPIDFKVFDAVTVGYIVEHNYKMKNKVGTKKLYFYFDKDFKMLDFSDNDKLNFHELISKKSKS